jgi:hypothetical protein
VPGREPEAEHRRRQEGGHEELHPERGGTHARGQLDVPDRRHRPRHPLASRAPQEPQPHEGEREHRCPAQEAVVAVEEQGHEPVGALEVAEREARIGGGLAGDVSRVGGGAAVDRLVDPHVQGDREERRLGPADRERAPPGSPQPARRDPTHHHTGGGELGAEPGQRAEHGEAQEGLAPSRPRVEPERHQPGTREQRPGAELGVDSGRVGQEGRREPHRQRRAERPGVGHHAQRHAVGERHAERGHEREEELHRLRATEREGRRDQQREPQPMRLVEPPVRRLAVLVEVVGVELVVGARGVLILDVHVPVVHERLRGQQVVRLVARVLGGPERVQPEGGRVDAEEEREEGSGPPHCGEPREWPRGLAAPAGSQDRARFPGL